MNIGDPYETTDKRRVTLIGVKNLHGKKIYVGTIDGVNAYAHWTDDGRRWGDKDVVSDIVPYVPHETENEDAAA